MTITDSNKHHNKRTHICISLLADTNDINYDLPAHSFEKYFFNIIIQFDLHLESN